MNEGDTGKEYRVRKMQPADTEAAHKLAARIPQSAQWAPADFARAVNSEYSSWVASRGTELIGFVVTRQVSGEVELLNLGVESGSRRQGIARHLLTTAMGKARRGGAQKGFLEVRVSNTVAIAFYHSAGFRFSGRRKDYYLNPTEDAVVMVMEPIR
jgi:ribosomal-protein-alanine N-acetyltransferase